MNREIVQQFLTGGLGMIKKDAVRICDFLTKKTIITNRTFTIHQT